MRPDHRQSNSQSPRSSGMSSGLRRMYANRPYSQQGKTFLSDMVERYQRPKSLVAEEKLPLSSKLWSMYADRVYSKWEKTFLWDMIEPYRRPKSFTPLVLIYIAAFYTGVIGSALTEQLYKEKYWEEHPGEAVPLMKPKFYYGPWKVLRGDFLPPNQ